MKLLLDAHVLLWVAGTPARLSSTARALLEDPQNELLFSAASLLEIAIKRSLGRSDFQVDARVLRRGLLDNRYLELGINSAHAVSIDSLPAIHKDPFDRILVAQATNEEVTLLTVNDWVAQYQARLSGSSHVTPNIA
jgi:PIN domain nuclease of toxin-antitoxin system